MLEWINSIWKFKKKCKKTYLSNVRIITAKKYVIFQILHFRCFLLRPAVFIFWQKYFREKCINASTTLFLESIYIIFIYHWEHSYSYIIFIVTNSIMKRKKRLHCVKIWHLLIKTGLCWMNKFLLSFESCCINYQDHQILQISLKCGVCSILCNPCNNRKSQAMYLF